MKKKLGKGAALLLAGLLALTAAPMGAQAAQAVSVELPVAVKVTGEAPSPAETYTVTLKSTDGAPMPQTDTAQVTGEGETKLAAITYTVPGIYCYTVSQTAGSHERGHYDGTVYYVRVSVTNAENGGLEAVVAAHKDAAMQGEKQDIVFTNRYDKTPSPVNPGGDQQTPSDPQEPAVTPQPTLPKTNATVTPGTGTQVLPVTDGNALPQTGGDHGARTGDESRMTLWLTVALAALAALAVVGACLYRRRKER